MQLAKLHRLIGLSSALFVIYLEVTGLLLNHSHDLEMDKKSVQLESVLNWYGIEKPQTLMSYRIGEHWLTQWQDHLYFDSNVIANNHYSLLGAVATSTFLVIAMEEEIWLLTIDGEVVEKLTSPGEKLGDIQQLGILNDHIVIATSTGQYLADADLIAWQPIKSNDVLWSRPAALPSNITTAIFAQTHSITRERLLLDLHSGRIFGQAGVIVVDLVAIILVLLAITGSLVWYKRARRLNRKA